jgi:hypothetical protein
MSMVSPFDQTPTSVVAISERVRNEWGTTTVSAKFLHSSEALVRGEKDSKPGKGPTLSP